MQRIFGKKKSNRNQICRIIERTNGRVRCIQIVSVLWRWFNRGFWVGLLILLRECIKLVHNRTFYSCSDTVLYGCTNAYSLYTASVAFELSINVDTIRLSGGKETITDKEQPLFTIIAHANSPRFYGVVVMFSPVALSPSLPISFAFSLSLSLSIRVHIYCCYLSLSLHLSLSLCRSLFSSQSRVSLRFRVVVLFRSVSNPYIHKVYSLCVWCLKWNVRYIRMRGTCMTLYSLDLSSRLDTVVLSARCWWALGRLRYILKYTYIAISTK